jgi:hypothetical protein
MVLSAHQKPLDRHGEDDDGVPLADLHVVRMCETDADAAGRDGRSPDPREAAADIELVLSGDMGLRPSGEPDVRALLADAGAERPRRHPPRDRGVHGRAVAPFTRILPGPTVDVDGQMMSANRKARRGAAAWAARAERKPCTCGDEEGFLPHKRGCPRYGT